MVRFFQDVEVRPERDGNIRVPPAHVGALHDGDERGHLRGRELLRREAVQELQPLLPVRIPASGGGHSRQGPRHRVQLLEQHLGLLLQRQEEG